jgi:hypothetical protein
MKSSCFQCFLSTFCSLKINASKITTLEGCALYLGDDVSILGSTAVEQFSLEAVITNMHHFVWCMLISYDGIVDSSNAIVDFFVYIFFP